MTYQKLTASLVLLLLICLQLKAQNGSYELRNVIPPSANVASLGKYGEIPVSLYTGLANISIPLYEIKDGPLNFPIRLSYHAGGIKVEEIASSVGLGWTLNAGGIVSRQVRGFADEYGQWIRPLANRVGYILQNGTQSQINSMTLDLETHLDGEPDIYSYNVNNQSGKFFFDQAGTLYNYPAKNVQIEQANGWTIKNEDGTIYEFAKYETVITASCSDDNNVTTAWFLTKMKSADGKREITFTYENVYYSNQVILGQTMYHSISVNGGNCLQENPPVCEANILTYTHRIKRIDFSGGYVLFNYESGERQDLAGEKKLDQVAIYTKTNSLVKKFDFTYSYFGAGSIDQYGKRLKLTSVTEKSATGQSPPHEFTYEESLAMPHRKSFSQDHWGYYNGKSNTTLIPAYAYYINGILQNLAGADRNANPQTMQACILKKVRYPTGGETTFTYETNTTSDTRIPTAADGVRYAGGLRLKEMEDNPGNGGQPVIKKYRYEISNNSTGILVNFPVYGYELDVNRRDPTGGSCDIPHGTDCRYFVRQSHSNYPMGTTQGGSIGYHHVEEIIEGNGETHYDFYAYTTPDYTFPFVPVNHYDWKRGSESNRKYYAKKNGQLVLSKEIFYGYTEVSKGTVRGYKTGRSSIYLGACARPIVNAPITPYDVTTQFFALNLINERLYDQNDVAKYIETTTDYVYDVNHFQVNLVRTSTSRSNAAIKDEIVVNKKYAQDYIFSGTPSGVEAQGIQKLKDLHVVNVPIEEYAVRQKRDISTGAISDQRVINSMITTYKSDNPYPDRIYALETILPIGISSFGNGSVVSSNSFSKNANPTIAGAYKSRLQMIGYDSYGNLTSQKKENDIVKSYLWGYNKSYPVAEIVGTDHATASSYIDQTVLDNPTSEVAMRTELNNLRSIPNTLVTTYTYKPLVGMTSSTDENGRTTYYEYDGFGRLSLIRDHDNNILKKVCYNYQGQVESCTSFGNESQSGVYYKQCPSGQTGSAVTYSVPANTYYGSSVTEANALAQADISQNGQAHANANGACTVTCTTSNCSGNNKKCINGICQTGIKIYTNSVQLHGSLWECTYHYEWSDGSWSPNYFESSSTRCSSAIE